MRPLRLNGLTTGAFQSHSRHKKCNMHIIITALLEVSYDSEAERIKDRPDSAWHAPPEREHHLLTIIAMSPCCAQTLQGEKESGRRWTRYFRHFCEHTRQQVGTDWQSKRMGEHSKAAPSERSWHAAVFSTQKARSKSATAPPAPLSSAFHTPDIRQTAGGNSLLRGAPLRLFLLVLSFPSFSIIQAWTYLWESELNLCLIFLQINTRDLQEMGIWSRWCISGFRFESSVNFEILKISSRNHFIKFFHRIVPVIVRDISTYTVVLKVM